MGKCIKCFLEIQVNDINCPTTVQNVSPMAKKRQKLQLTERPLTKTNWQLPRRFFSSKWVMTSIIIDSIIFQATGVKQAGRWLVGSLRYPFWKHMTNNCFTDTWHWLWNIFISHVWEVYMHFFEKHRQCRHYSLCV